MRELLKLNNHLILEPQRLTSPTVKVRRLGYLAAIPSIVQDREIPTMMLKKRVLEWAKENRTSFKHYSFNLPVIRIRKRAFTGEIRTMGGAGRYVKTCEELGLIVKMKGFRISKVGTVISALSTHANPFELTLGQMFLVLRVLLEKDYDCLVTLCKILSKNEKEEIELFQKDIQRRLQKKVEVATRKNRLYLVDTLKKRIGFIRHWRNPHRYYHENIKAPRFEWMLDLKFSKYWNQRTDIFELRHNTSDFFREEMISYEWLEDKFPSIFAGFYFDRFKTRVKYWTNLSREEKLKFLTSLISKSMETFETGSELGKISASEFFDYSIAFLIQNESVVTRLSEFERDLNSFISSGRLKYRYVRTVSMADKGYIARD